MCSLRIHNGVSSYKQRSKRARMGTRRGGRVSMSYWQRVRDPVYISEDAIGAASAVFKDTVHAAITEALAFGAAAFDEEVDRIEDLVYELYEDLVESTPLDPDGPNDPPLHATDSWRVKLEKQGPNRILFTVSNPKDYMQFLEAYGGVHDSYGNETIMPAGFIAAAFEDFALKVRMR